MLHLSITSSSSPTTCNTYPALTLSVGAISTSPPFDCYSYARPRRYSINLMLFRTDPKGHRGLFTRPSVHPLPDEVFLQALPIHQRGRVVLGSLGNVGAVLPRRKSGEVFGYVSDRMSSESVANKLNASIRLVCVLITHAFRLSQFSDQN